MTEDGLSFHSVGRTHAGAVRVLNEDAFMEDVASGLWAVADGVGGHAAGDYASAQAVHLLQQIGSRQNAASLLAAVRERLEMCDANLRAFAANEGIGTAATTIVALLCFGRHYAAVWAGDSRIYLWRQGALSQLTRDHSEVQELVDHGLLTPEAARRHPRANVITRAVGAGDGFGLEIVHGRLMPNDIFLLCSDGVTKVLEDAEIATCLARLDLTEAAEMILDTVLARGAPDNTTAVVVGCHADESSTFP